MAYNGWSNWETWVCNLWLDNDPGWDWDSAIEAGADGLRDLVSEYNGLTETADQGGMLGDIVKGFLNDVNWREIVDSHLADRDYLGAVLSDTLIEAIHDRAEFESDPAVVRGHMLSFSNMHLKRYSVDREDVESVYIVRDPVSKRRLAVYAGADGEYTRIK